MRTCSKCRSEIAPGDVFCGGCGGRQPALQAQVSPEQGSRLVAAAGFESPPPVAVGAGFEPATGGAGAHSAPGGARAAGPAGEPLGPNGNIQQSHVTSTGTAAPAARAAAPAPRAGAPASRAGAPASRAALLRAGETIEQKYMRQTRTATVFIAVVVGIFTALALIGVIWTATNVARLNSQLTGIPGVNSNNCLSQGGTNSDC